MTNLEERKKGISEILISKTEEFNKVKAYQDNLEKEILQLAGKAQMLEELILEDKKKEVEPTEVKEK